jgi:hypothetical protein
MKRCPVCDSKELYEYKKAYRHSGMGEEVLPKLGSTVFWPAKLRPTVCAACGYISLFASEEARRKLRESVHWKPISE